MKTTLYKKAKNGKTQEWTIEVRGAHFRTTEGYVDGAETTSEWTKCKGKRIGASNETTPEEQAIKEAEAKIKKQKDKGYTEDIDNLEAAAKKISPMLAHKYPDYKDKLKGIELSAQPKLDGIRCVATEEGLFTRNGKPILTAPHILEEVKLLFNEMRPFKGFIDGELYNHELKDDFNKITSLVRKQNPDAGELEQARQLLQYHIYDFDTPNKSFIDRFSTLKLGFMRKYQYLKLVHTVHTTGVLIGEDQLPELDFLYGKWLEQGFEGQMVRLTKSLYENSRSKSLLKRKEFEEAEFTIVDIEEGVGNRSKMMGRIKFDGFDSNARGSHEFFRHLLVNKNEYIGKKATVRYQNLTPDGKPRFPVMIAIRDYE